MLFSWHTNVPAVEPQSRRGKKGGYTTSSILLAFIVNRTFSSELHLRGRTYRVTNSLVQDLHSGDVPIPNLVERQHTSFPLTITSVVFRVFSTTRVQNSAVACTSQKLLNITMEVPRRKEPLS